MLTMLFLAPSAFPQSSHREAVKWFNIGLKERNDYQAIEAYKKAIALDPDFSEAIINTGMRYNGVGDLVQAERFLEMALATKKDEIAADMKFKILYEIANIYLRKGEHKTYEKKVKAARAVTQNKTLLAALSFEYGRFLYQQKRYREAVLELRKGLLANPPNREYFENLISLADNAQQRKDLYIEATAEETSGRFETARKRIESKSTEFDPPNMLSFEFQAKKDSLFQVAEIFIEREDWQAALSAFELIRAVFPKDARTIEHIAAIRANLNIAATAPAYSARTSFGKIVLFAGGAVTLLIVLPVAGAFVFVPTVRMRYFLMVGNLSQAASIIEKLVERNPGRLKLYPLLANIYLLTRQNDARAIKIYRTVVQLNLAKHNKQAIDAMLAQYYLTESSETDQEALRILEEKLQEEMRKKAQ